ncbi:ArsR/SmtB family transcription factor [Sulfuriroseicoccus oceanibius]|uniref:Winged helix-turn-helix transcriptional regulator n=1 Tax=Sulfuriroseicoccus oceanibius TaxID=2707525 RepID=A0A6B3L829_9BACT|nr:metalloregulator ArsR/SmtB family transcription factor [Sulfuriroseicoccus oceanibius]QQL44118.1 winged helix-turn-helix transcriptional regulator [Sulfuriroseicoccus oceanibius]
MAFAKIDDFDRETIEMAEFAGALSHPARIALLTYLIDHPGAPCRDLVDHLPLSQPSCSRHLSELRKADLVSATPHGNEVRYELNIERIKLFCDAFRNSLNRPSCGN